MCIYSIDTYRLLNGQFEICSIFLFGYFKRAWHLTANVFHCCCLLKHILSLSSFFLQSLWHTKLRIVKVPNLKIDKNPKNEKSKENRMGSIILYRYTYGGVQGFLYRPRQWQKYHSQARDKELLEEIKNSRKKNSGAGKSLHYPTQKNL